MTRDKQQQLLRQCSEGLRAVNSGDPEADHGTIENMLLDLVRDLCPSSGPAVDALVEAYNSVYVY